MAAQRPKSSVTSGAWSLARWSSQMCSCWALAGMPGVPRWSSNGQTAPTPLWLIDVTMVTRVACAQVRQQVDVGARHGLDASAPQLALAGLQRCDLGRHHQPPPVGLGLLGNPHAAAALPSSAGLRPPPAAWQRGSPGPCRIAAAPIWRPGLRSRCLRPLCPCPGCARRARWRQSAPDGAGWSRPG